MFTFSPQWLSTWPLILFAHSFALIILVDFGSGTTIIISVTTGKLIHCGHSALANDTCTFFDAHASTELGAGKLPHSRAHDFSVTILWRLFSCTFAPQYFSSVRVKNSSSVYVLFFTEKIYTFQITSLLFVTKLTLNWWWSYSKPVAVSWTAFELIITTTTDLPTSEALVSLSLNLLPICLVYFELGKSQSGAIFLYFKCGSLFFRSTLSSPEKI